MSRDLDDLGAIKVRGADGEAVYAIPELPKDQRAPDDHLRRVFGDWVVEVAASAQPRRAAHAARARPTSSARPSTGRRCRAVLGTVAGDDTLIVVVADEVGGQAVAAELRDLAGL